jgi:hypothetical protein
VKSGIQPLCTIVARRTLLQFCKLRLLGTGASGTVWFAEDWEHVSMQNDADRDDVRKDHGRLDLRSLDDFFTHLGKELTPQGIRNKLPSRSRI